jgi:membrane protease YdiL (CAAX protease family)
VVGMGMGSLFALTGSLWGPLFAHMAINLLNLQFLRATELRPKKRPLGGLFRPS